MPCRQTVAIIGGGASGLLTAIQILSQSRSGGPRVYLMEKSGAFDFGAAYSTAEPSHLLNVRAGNMSAFPDKPTHFTDWLNEAATAAGKTGPTPAFVSRRTYRNYLASILRNAATGPDAAGRLFIVPDEAVSIKETEAGSYIIRLALGKDLTADCAVLALGNLAPDPPGIDGNDVLASSLYCSNPWAADLADFKGRAGAILILGTGLTMIDYVLALFDHGYAGTVFALSRRGLIPRQHAMTPAAPPLKPPVLSPRITASLRSVRQAIRERCGAGGDWRDVIDSLRPATIPYWCSLSFEEQRRFLRHLRPWWDVHRHRLAPETSERFARLMGEGRVQLIRGRLKSLSFSGDTQLPVKAIWTPFASTDISELAVEAVVNCMGPGRARAPCSSPLVQKMENAGMVSPDRHGLGLAVREDGRLLDGNGQETRGLFAIGPITRGTFWEVTAIPDIRVKAAELAGSVLTALERTKEDRPSP